jgi:hypothetical protein
MIKSMYRNTNLSVKVNKGERTNFFKSEVGIRQGDNLSPNLFKIIMDDLPRVLELANFNPVSLNNSPITCLMYADDIVLLSKSPEGLQKVIQCTADYGFSQGLELNTKKKQIMCISTSGKTSNMTFNLQWP